MVAEGVLAIEYGASAEDVARTTHAHVCIFIFIFIYYPYDFFFSLRSAKLSKKLRWLRTPNPSTCKLDFFFDIEAGFLSPPPPFFVM